MIDFNWTLMKMNNYEILSFTSRLASMRNKLACYLLTLAIVTLIGCGTGHNEAQTKTDSINTFIPIDSLKRDTVELKESFNQEDEPFNEYFTEKLKPLRANFKRINSITNWTNKENKEISASGDGGEAKFYYLNGQLEKIITRYFGETFQNLTEYYLPKGEISFVFEKSYNYNRPIYYDSAAMKESNDNETFDFEKSEITEDPSYFENGKLLHQINSEDCGSPFAKD